MAKSLRSKWRRKMRAEKRIRYGKKELATLIKITAPHQLTVSKDAEMTDTEPTDFEEMDLSRRVEKITKPLPWMNQRRLKRLKTQKVKVKKIKNKKTAKKNK